MFQGAPLSPILFNLAINHISEELPEPDITRKFGFNLINKNEVSPLSILGYADDTVIIEKSFVAANGLPLMVESKFIEIGFKINASKSSSIVIENGILRNKSLNTISNQKIISMNHDETIKYLCVPFSDLLILDENTISKNLSNRIEILTKALVLALDQKFNILR